MAVTAPASPPPSSFHAGSTSWLREAAFDWMFVAKGVIAVLLAGWLAMRFSLAQPGTAMMTVAIVIHPQSGTVLAKSFYRALGTLAGCAVALLVVAAFAQQGELFLLAMAAWIGICAGGAALHRNFRSYGFVLAGYTAAIVALPVVAQPQNVFDSAIMRVSEVMLGIFVAGVVSDAIFPQRLGDVLRASVRTQFAGFIVFLRGSLRGTLPRDEIGAAHLRFVRDVVQIENQRSSVVFEGGGQRERSPRLRRFNHAFMALSTSVQSLHRLLDRLATGAVRDGLLELAAELGDALGQPGQEPRTAAQAGPLADRVDAWRAREAARIAHVQAGVDGRAARLDFATGAQLLARIAVELREYTAAYAGLARPHVAPERGEGRVRFTHANDWAGAGIAALRAAATMLALGAFWLATAWPEGAGTMLIATVFSGLMASVPDPRRAIRTMLGGYALGIVLGIVCLDVVLTRMDGFVLLCAGLTPFLLLGFYLVTRPAWQGLGTGYLLALLYTVAVKNPMQFDALHSINDSLGQLAGVGAAGVAFMAFSAASDSAWLRGRLARKLRMQVSQACTRPLPGLRARFESASCDLAAQIVAHTRAGSDESRSMLAWSLSVHETGRAVIELRDALAAHATDDAQRERVDGVLRELAALYARPRRIAWQRARNAVATAIDSAANDSPLTTHLHLIRLALLDVDALLGDAIAPAATAATTRDEALHAA